MKKYYIYITILILGMAYLLSVNVDSNESVEQLVVRVANDYSKEQHFNGQCSIDGVNVSLAQFIYGLGKAEGGFNPNGQGFKTNNVGSLRKGMGMKKVIGTKNIDNSKTRPVYETMYDGLYDKTHLIASSDFMYKCKYTYRTSLCYTVGCKANENDIMASGISKKQNAINHMSNAKSRAMKLNGESPAKQEIKKEIKEDLFQKAFKEEAKLEYRKNQKRIAIENVSAHTNKAQNYWRECKGTEFCKE